MLYSCHSEVEDWSPHKALLLCCSSFAAVPLLLECFSDCLTALLDRWPCAFFPC